MILPEIKVEFETLLKELRDTVYSYGYEDILEYDMQNARG